ncbi:MAG: carboxymuconolactone decarboxylase family protein [Gammaproteobacteria bacterium]
MGARLAVARQAGLDEAKIAEVPRYRESALLNAREKAAIHYAEVLAGDHQSADQALFDELRTQFSEAEIIDLGIRIMTFVGYGRLVRVLGLEIGGTCPLPHPG